MHSSFPKEYEGLFNQVEKCAARINEIEQEIVTMSQDKGPKPELKPEGVPPTKPKVDKTKKIEKLNVEKEKIQNHVIKITKDALRFADKETAGQAKEVVGQKIKLPTDDKRLIEDSIKPSLKNDFLKKMQSPSKQFPDNKEDIAKVGPPKSFLEKMRNPKGKLLDNKDDILKSEFNKEPSISFLEKMKDEVARDKSINAPSDSFLEKMKYPRVSADYADNKKDLTKEKGLSPDI